MTGPGTDIVIIGSGMGGATCAAAVVPTERGLWCQSRLHDPRVIEGINEHVLMCGSLITQDAEG